MQTEFTDNHTHNTHNEPERLPESGSVYCVQGFGRIEKLFSELKALGVVLSIDADGRLVYDAPDGVLTDDLLVRMRAERDGLWAWVEQREKRAAIVEHDGGGADVLPEPERLEPMTGFYCPWCRSACDLIEIVDGLHCLNCNRRAWHFADDGAIVRCDWLEPRLLEAPAVSIDVVVEKRPTKIEHNERSYPGLTLESFP